MQYLISPECVKPNPPDYPNADAYVRCAKQRSKVSAVFIAVIFGIVIIVAILVLSLNKTMTRTKRVWGFVITLTVAALVASVYYQSQKWAAWRAGRDYKTFTSYCKDGKVTEQCKTDWYKSRDETLKEQQVAASQQQAGAQTAIAVSSGLMAAESLFGRR